MRYTDCSSSQTLHRTQERHTCNGYRIPQGFHINRHFTMLDLFCSITGAILIGGILKGNMQARHSKRHIPSSPNRSRSIYGGPSVPCIPSYVSANRSFGIPSTQPSQASHHHSRYTNLRAVTTLTACACRSVAFSTGITLGEHASVAAFPESCVDFPELC